MATERAGFSEILPIWSQDNGGALFHPLGTATLAALIKGARPGIYLSHPQGVVASARVGWQLSDDGLTWPSSTTYSSNDGDLFATGTLASQTTESVTLATAFEDINAKMLRRHLRWGPVISGGNSARVLCYGGIRIETRSC